MNPTRSLAPAVLSGIMTNLYCIGLLLLLEPQALHYFSEKDLSVTRTKNEIDMYTIKCAECGCYPEDWIVLLSANSFIGLLLACHFLGIGTALVYLLNLRQLVM